MIINTASQKIGAQLVSASDGSAFTGAVTVAVTVDAGAQATGSVGSGACTHEGNGYHTYAPAQAETNGALIAFTFTGTGAIPATVQVYTIAGDAFTRLGAPAGASVSADIAAIEAQTDDIGAAGAGLTAADDAILALLGTPAGASVSADIAAVKAQTAAIETDTAEIGAAGAGLTNINLPNQTMDIVGNITGNLSGSVGSVTGAVGSVTGAVGSVTGNVGGNVVGTVASVVGAVGSVTGNVGGNVAGSVASVTAEVNANVQKINDVTLVGDGSGTPWGPA
jgi:hypothetical protein